MRVKDTVKAIMEKGKKYKCFWCNHRFKALPENWTGNAPQMGVLAKHKGCGSSTIVCTNCSRKVPTWSREDTGDNHGRKHSHIKNWGSNQMLFGTKLMESDF